MPKQQQHWTLLIEPAVSGSQSERPGSDLHDDQTVGKNDSSTDDDDEETLTQQSCIRMPHKVPSSEEETAGPAAAITAPPIAAYWLLLSAIISLSSIGPLLKLQDGVNAILKVSWRATGTACFLFPMAARSVYLEGWPRGLTLSQWAMLPVTAITYTALVVCFSASLNYISVGNAVVLSNSQSLLLLVWKFVAGGSLTLWETVGALVAFTGAVFCSQHNSAMSESELDTQHETPPLYFTCIGDALAIGSAIAGAIYIVFAKSAQMHMNLYVFMFFNMVQTALYSMVLCYLSGAPMSFNRHEDHGIFGWLNPQFDRFPLQVVIVLVCNLLGVMGYVRALQYFDTLVISVAGLMEPVVAQLMACLFGVGFLPGWEGWLGNALVISGTFAVVYQAYDNKSANENNRVNDNNNNNKSTNDIP